MHGFALPVATPEVTVSLLWHPRQDAAPAHRWLRGCVRDTCATVGSNQHIERTDNILTA
jgi:DNA-binding transcriptional LysR family regulator